MKKILLVTFSDNADHQDTLFGLYEQLAPIRETYLLAIKKPKVPLIVSDHTWLVNCPKRPGITLKTFDFFTLFSIIRRIRKEKFDIVYFESLHVWNIVQMEDGNYHIDVCMGYPQFRFIYEEKDLRYNKYSAFCAYGAD